MLSRVSLFFCFLQHVCFSEWCRVHIVLFNAVEQSVGVALVNIVVKVEAAVSLMTTSPQAEARFGSLYHLHVSSVQLRASETVQLTPGIFTTFTANPAATRSTCGRCRTCLASQNPDLSDNRSCHAVGIRNRKGAVQKCQTRMTSKVQDAVLKAFMAFGRLTEC